MDDNRNNYTEDITEKRVGENVEEIIDEMNKQEEAAKTEVPERPVNPRRRKRSKMQDFKEAYLPVVIAAVALVLIIVFIAGSSGRAQQLKDALENSSIAASLAASESAQKLEDEAQALIAEAEVHAANYDYLSAISVLERFSGKLKDNAALTAKHAEYFDAHSKLIPWSDPGQVVNLSFQLLIADPIRAFNDNIYGSAYKRNFVTIDEFSRIMQQLYDNGYMLVSLDDIITVSTDESGNSVYVPKTLYLPEGKKPLMLTQTQVNYYTYMTDSDGDYLPDANADGFASKLIIGEDGKLTNEYIDSAGNVLTGAYDMVPLLNAFIEEHPDFSYRGAKAILAVTGYDGVFGYRTSITAGNRFGEDYRNSEIAKASVIIDALRADGYEIACYTYGNMAYGNLSLTEISIDQTYWANTVANFLYDVDILVYASTSDIADEGTLYEGEKFQILADRGFKYYLGFSNNGTPWATISDSYVRQGRILVTGSKLTGNSDWFLGLFDPASVLDGYRG